MLNKLRQLFSKSINPISEDTGQELTDIDISRIRLKTKSDIIADLLQKGQSLQENYNEALVQYNDLTKGNTNEAILKRLNTRIDQIEQSYLQDKYNQVQQLKKAENDLYSCIKDHCQLLKAINTSQTGDFKYKKYLLNTLNRTRDTMPQIDSDNIDDVILHFQGKSPDSKVTKENISLSDLKFAQNEINEDKVLEILENIDPDKLTRFLVSKDNYIIDGNHRICALCEIDEEMEVPCYKIHLDAKEAIRRLNLMKITRNDDITKGEDDDSFEIIQKAFNDDLITPEQYYQAKQQYDLIKARSGVYADTAQNRKLKRVGQKYGSNEQQDQSNAKQGQNNDSKQPKSYSDAELQDYAKNASQQDLERQIKESSDPKLREHAHRELDRRNKEEAIKANNN